MRYTLFILLVFFVLNSKAQNNTESQGRVILTPAMKKQQSGAQTFVVTEEMRKKMDTDNASHTNPPDVNNFSNSAVKKTEATNLNPETPIINGQKVYRSRPVTKNDPLKNEVLNEK